MYTYQDLQNQEQTELGKMEFVKAVISDHKMSELYMTAVVAEKYDKHKNETINQYQKILYTVTGQAVPDNWSANFKMASRHFHRFITQENQYLLSNGATWGDEKTAGKLGNRKYPFDNQLQKAGKLALIGGVSFGFFNFDHIDVFGVTEFAPLYDEENGSLSAGVRFWQIDDKKPLRATLYEIDGYTDYIWKNGKGEVLHDGKKPYKTVIRASEADGEEIYDGENYPGFPIVPLWGNPEHQSELVGMREQIDCYDLIKSGFANTVDEASLVFWTLQNAGGMDDTDLAEFVERIKTVHAATLNSGVEAQSHTQDAPFQSREALLNRLEKDMYNDAMALNLQDIVGGAATATQINAAYEPLDEKCNDYEFCVLDFINGILEIAEIEDDVAFTRSKVTNVAEMVQTVIQAAEWTGEDYTTKKILTLLGDGDLADHIIEEKDANELGRVSVTPSALNRGSSPFEDEESDEGITESQGEV